MSQVLLINKRKRRTRRNPESRRTRSAAAKRGWAHRRKTRRNPWSGQKRVARRRNPWYGQKRRHATAARKGWRGRRRHNPRGISLQGFMNNTLIPGSVGAVGALGLDVILGYIPLPAALSGPMVKNVVRLVGAAALGMAASKVVNRHVGEQVAAGATIVILYDVFKGLAQQALPALPLAGMEYYSPGVQVGEYVTQVPHQAAPQAVAHTSGVAMPVNSGVNMAEYVF